MQNKRDTIVYREKILTVYYLSRGYNTHDFKFEYLNNLI
jgi:hypothetical protein